MDYLTEIFNNKRQEIILQKKMVSEEELRETINIIPPALPFSHYINKSSYPALIAEVKYRSPSKGVLLKEFDPVELALIYTNNGASAISVVTDEKYFGGSLDNLSRIRSVLPSIPILRKDFIFDPYQIYQSRYYGADAVLLIVAALEINELKILNDLIVSMGMTALIEVHSEEELEKALFIRPSLVGINNRNLSTFIIDMNTTFRLRPLIPDNILVVSESGINTSDDIELLREANVNAILVGEALVKAPSIADKVKMISKSVELDVWDEN